MAPSHRLTRCFCMNRGVSFKGTGLVVAFLPVYALRQGTRRYMAEKFILTHAHTHTRCHMRCFKEIATTGTGSVDAEVVQPVDEFLHRKHSLE